MTLDLHAITDQGVTHVCTVHRVAKDETPLQMISMQRLAQLLEAEAELLARRASRDALRPEQHLTRQVERQDIGALATESLI